MSGERKAEEIGWGGGSHGLLGALTQPRSPAGGVARWCVWGRSGSALGRRCNVSAVRWDCAPWDRISGQDMGWILGWRFMSFRVMRVTRGAGIRPSGGGGDMRRFVRRIRGRGLRTEGTMVPEAH